MKIEEIKRLLFTRWIETLENFTWAIDFKMPDWYIDNLRAKLLEQEEIINLLGFSEDFEAVEMTFTLE